MLNPSVFEKPNYFFRFKKIMHQKLLSRLSPSNFLRIVDQALRPIQTTAGIGLFCLLLFSIYAFCTFFPGVIFTNTAACDNYIFIDGVHRIWSGHIPHLDFSTALGALNFFWPAMFGIVTESEFKAFLLYQISFLAVMLAILVYISRTRLNYFCAIILSIYLAAIVATPVPMGLPGHFVTYATYYNRFGWALMTISFLMMLKPRTAKTHIRLIDALLVTVLLGIAFYTKITYFFAIAGTFFLFSLFERYWLKALIIGSLGFLTCVVLLEIVHLGIHLAYGRDLLMAGKSTPGIIADFWDNLSRNLPQIMGVIFSILIVFMVTEKDAISHFPLFAAAACWNILTAVFVSTHNYDDGGLPSLLAVYVTGLMLVVQKARPLHALATYQKTALVVMATLIVFSSVPEAIERQSALERFFRLGCFHNRYPYPFPFPEPMREMKIIEGPVGFLEKVDTNGKVNLTVEDLRVAGASPRQEIYQTQYAYVISQGYGVLLDLFAKWGPGPVINLDFSNPFSTLLGTPSARGDYAWYHGNRNISKNAHFPPERVFQEVKYVMISRFPPFEETADLLLEIYGDYLKENFKLIYSGAFWQVWLAKPVGATQKKA